MVCVCVCVCGVCVCGVCVWCVCVVCVCGVWCVVCGVCVHVCGVCVCVRARVHDRCICDSVEFSLTSLGMYVHAKLMYMSRTRHSCLW